MAQKVTTTFVDDLDGTEKDVKTVTFGLDGTTFEIDLGPKNEEKLRAALAEFVAAGRKIRGGSAKAAKSSQSGPSAADVRAWATANGFAVPDRGRIPADVRAAYDKAN